MCTCIVTAQIEVVGDAPLRALLESLGRWPVIDDQWSEEDIVLEDILGDMRGKHNAPILLDVWIGPDDKNSTVNILQVKLGQSVIRVIFIYMYLYCKYFSPIDYQYKF